MAAVVPSMAALLFVITFVVGLFLVYRGIRGVPALSDPKCAKCGYDLRWVKPDVNLVCPECGSDLKAPRSVRFGRVPATAAVDRDRPGGDTDRGRNARRAVGGAEHVERHGRGNAGSNDADEDADHQPGDNGRPALGLERTRPPTGGRPDGGQGRRRRDRSTDQQPEILGATTRLNRCIGPNASSSVPTRPD